MSERKLYRTMQGKMLDFDSIRLSNELTPAVGNMRVNARGDEISSSGNIVRTRDEITETKTQRELKTLEEFKEDFGPEPEITPEEAQKILAKNRGKNKTQEK
jgi:hypothetical protein